MLLSQNTQQRKAYSWSIYKFNAIRINFLWSTNHIFSYKGMKCNLRECSGKSPWTRIYVRTYKAEIVTRVAESSFTCWYSLFVINKGICGRIQVFLTTRDLSKGKNPFHCLRLDALCDWFILVSLVGTFPSARDLSLGKSLRVKRHDWLAELIQRKFILLARNLCWVHCWIHSYQRE